MKVPDIQLLAPMLNFLKRTDRGKVFMQSVFYIMKNGRSEVEKSEID